VQRLGAVARPVLDQGPIPNPVASSVDEHRIIRHAYGAMHGYARLMPEAFAAWRRLWDDLGHDQLEPVPATYCLRLESDWYDNVSASLRALGIPFRDIPLDAVAAALPMLRRDGLLRVVETQGAGLLFAHRIVEDLVRFLPSRGVTLVPNTAIDTIDAERGIARAGGRSWAGDHLVVAAGAWLPRLLGALPEAPRPSVQTVVYLEPPVELAAAWQSARRCCSTAWRPRRAASISCRRSVARGSRSAITTIRSRVTRIIEAKACFYTVTRDERFALRPLGARGWLLSACSGHGFKLAALMGTGIGDAIDGIRSPSEIAHWAAGRISDSRPAGAA
jgi:glycine/D-amino acid oxidase-like deaminating enzyme